MDTKHTATFLNHAAEIHAGGSHLFDIAGASQEQVHKIVRMLDAHDDLVATLKEIASRGPVDGYSSASALLTRLVGTQTIARAALAKAGAA